MRSGDTMVKTILWPVVRSNSAARILVAACTEPTRSTRMSSAAAFDAAVRATTAAIHACRCGIDHDLPAAARSRMRKLLGDGIDHARIHRLDVSGKYRCDAAIMS